MGITKDIDVKDSDAVEFIKAKWLRMGFAANKEEETFTEDTLDEMFITYSQCFQLPNLIEKLFCAIKEVITESSGGVFFTSGQVPTSLLKTFRTCVCQLPHQQNFKLWQLFLNESKNFFFKSNPQIPLQGGALILAQFFASFLCHMNIVALMSFHSQQANVESLVRKTEAFVLSDAQLFNMTNINMKNYYVAHLILMVAFRKLRSVYNFSLGSDSTDHLSDLCCGFEFLPDHSTECNKMDYFLTYLDSCDKRISFCMMQLMIERMSSLMGCQKCEELVADKEKGLKHIMSVLTAHTVSAMSRGTDCCWDMNINSLDEDSYKVAAVCIYVSQLPRFLDFIDARDLSEFCLALITVVSQNQGNPSSSAQEITLCDSLQKLLISEFFKESAAMQSAFVTALWNYARSIFVVKSSNSDPPVVCDIMEKLCGSPSRWVKYAATTPKCGNEPNSMWVSISNISQLMMNLFSDPFAISTAFIHHQHLVLIEIMNYLPLEYLLPGNQMRCLIGLTLSILILANGMETRSHDGTTKFSPEILQSMESAFNTIVAILDGVRSIWLFDCIDANSYLHVMIMIIDRMRSMDKSRTYCWVKPLFERLLDLSTRNAVSITKLEEYVPQLAVDMVDSLTAAEVFCFSLHRLAQLLERVYLTPECKQSCERLAILIFSKMNKHMKKHYQDKAVESQRLSCLVGCYSGLLRLSATPAMRAHQSSQKTKWLKWIPNIIDIVLENLSTCTEEFDLEVHLNFICKTISCKELLLNDIPNDITSKCWNSFKSLFSRRREEAKNLLIKNLTKLSSSTKISQPGHRVCCKLSESVVLDLECGSTDLDITCMSLKFSHIESKAMSSVLNSTSDQEFKSIANDIFLEIGKEDADINAIDAFNYQVVLKIFELLCETANGDKLITISKLLQQMLLKMNSILNQTCSSPACLLAFVLPTLDFVSFAMGKKMKKMIMPRPYIVHCLHSCVVVDVAAYVEVPVLFIAVHHAVLRVLSLLLSSHPGPILPCRIAIIPCVTNLLKSVVFAGNQDLMLKLDDDTRSQVVLCARNMEGLFASMSQNETEFSKMVPYLIADYVDFVQNVTLHPSMKSALMTAINRLLDMCSKESLTMLSVNVSHSCREIYHSLLKAYKKGRYVGEV